MVHCVGTVCTDLHLKHGVGARAADALNRDACGGQVRSKAAVIDREMDKFANPFGRKFHDQLLALKLLALGLEPKKANGQELLFNRTAAKTARPLERNIANHLGRTSTALACPRPCRMRIPKFS